MARARNADDLLAAELRTILGAERALAGLLGRLAVEAADVQLANAIQRHRAETEQQVLNVESALRIVGADELPLESPAAAGLAREHEESMAGIDRQAPSDLRDLVVAGSVAHLELYEIGSYEAALEKAELMGETDVVELLEDNLNSEREMLDTGRHIAGRLARGLVQAPAGE